MSADVGGADGWLVPVQQLGQAGGGSPGGMLLWIGLLIGAVMAGAVVIMLVRRQLLGRQDGGGSGGLGLEGLRRLRTEGRISEDEYQAATRAMRARLAGEVRAAPRPNGSGPGSRRAPGRRGGRA